MSAPIADLGITHSPTGGTLRVWSGRATRMECVLCDADGVPERVVPMARKNGAWQVTDVELAPGRRYGIRVDGPTEPGDAFDATRTLLDPYARFVEHTDAGWRSVVVADDDFHWQAARPATPLRDTVIYEAHTKGLTALAPFLPPELRGTYAGLGHPATIALLRQLGVTAIELLPIQAFTSERHLDAAGLTNYWGYNTLGFFAPHAAYATQAARDAGAEAVMREVKQAIDSLHAAGLEVLLDVVYNHTADEDAQGAPLLFRGIDNQGYYRTDDHGSLVDVTGCGNAVDTSKPVPAQLVLDSLSYWRNSFQVDGFRFDLAPTLGRDADHRFGTDHPLLHAIAEDERLQGAKVIAEPWDIGAGGWQTGNFPTGWSEWNDEYRDRVRRFWVADFAHSRRTGTFSEGIGNLTTALAGSSNRFSNERGPLASVNFVTAHDGFTLRDLVSFNVKHNLQNAELNRDGTSANMSFNFGVEGETADPQILADRRRASRNLLGTLLISAGVPMLTAGDEFGRTQRGNNNAYNQDSPLSWVPWTTEPEAMALREHLTRLLDIRRNHPALRPAAFNHGHELEPDTTRLRWFDALGGPIDEWEWNSPAMRSVQFLADTPIDGGTDQLLVMLHGLEDEAVFRLPEIEGVGHFRLVWDSTAERVRDIDADAITRAITPGRMLPITGPTIRIFEIEGEAGLA